MQTVYIRIAPSVLLILGISLFGFSQNENDFTRFTVNDGLPSLLISDVLQDHKGYIWLGTEAGLCRYDGYQFQTFSLKDGIPNDEIFSLAEDSAGRLWINSIRALHVYENNQFRTLLEWKKHSSFGFSLSESEGEPTYIAARNKLYWVDSLLQFYPIPLPKAAARNQLAVFQDRKEQHWAFNGHSFYLLQHGKIAKQILVQPETEKSAHQVITAVAFKDLLLFCNANGLQAYDQKRDTLLFLDTTPLKWKRLMVVDDQVCLLLFSDGIKRYEIDHQGRIVATATIFEDDIPSAFIKDRESNYWLASYGKGLFFAAAKSIEPIKIYPTTDDEASTITSLLVTEDRTIIGTNIGTIHALERQHTTSATLPSPTRLNRILDISPVGNQEFLFATDVGLYRWNNAQPVLLKRGAAKAVSSNKAGTIFFTSAVAAASSTTDRLLEVEQDIGYIINSETIIYPGRSFAATIDEADRMWFDASKDGLVRYDQGEYFHYATLDPIFKSNITQLIFDESTGLLYVSTLGEGVLVIRDSTFIQIDEEAGLPSNFCNDLYLEDGKLFIATNRGLAYLKDLNFEQHTYSITSIDQMDGLPSNEITRIGKRGHHIFLATDKGLFQIKESELAKGTTPPVIDISKVIINEEAVALQSVYQLKGDENNIRINYVGLSQQSAGKVTYKYQLEGIDQNWISTRSLETHYSDLPPGDYTFRVAAIGKRGQESSHPASINFQIAPLFYESYWFRFLISLLGLVLILGASYLLHIVQQRRNLQIVVKEATAALNKKVSDLAEANTKLAQSNEELQEFAHVASHDLKTPLRNIAGFIQLLKRRLANRLKQDEAEFI
ncbi:MAG: triple tyrosine motif-containing protein, partial [Bacteroidota bacterium]